MKKKKMDDPRIHRLFSQAFDACKVFERTGKRLQFIALADQCDALNDELKKENHQQTGPKAGEAK